MPQLAGQALSTWTPRGLQSATTIPAALVAGPAVLAGASPRAMGEIAYYTGKAAKGKNALSRFMAQRVNPRIAANVAYQAQQPKNK